MNECLNNFYTKNEYDSKMDSEKFEVYHSKCQNCEYLKFDYNQGLIICTKFN